MQTFLPYADFAASARTLDMKRLGKQRVETLQILKSLADPGYGWKNHPAVRMWRGHAHTLFCYQLAICHEWAVVRGYRDTCFVKSLEIIESMGPLDRTDPFWLGEEALHLSHQSNLVRKLPEHYAPLFPGVPDDLEYVWPVREAVAA